MITSDKGVTFIAVHEGRVHKAYKDSVGVVTIGVGFTMRSRVFAAYWRSTKGHDLRLGDTITNAECDTLLKRLLDEEYTTAIVAKAKPTAQHQFDACASVSYNAGPGSLGDGWARLLAQGNVHAAAAALRVYKLTRGLLKSRRADEASLLEFGRYGPGDEVVGTPAAPSVSTSGSDVQAYQEQLAKLGFYHGSTAGDPAASAAAVLAYQHSHPDLIGDGVVGPATRASLARDVAAMTAAPKAAVATMAAAATTAAVTAAAGSPHWHLWAIGLGLAALVAVGGSLAFHYRAEIGRLTKGKGSS